jgi:hypothetical protein
MNPLRGCAGTLRVLVGAAFLCLLGSSAFAQEAAGDLEARLARLRLVNDRYKADEPRLPQDADDNEFEPK